ncbi:hypothetical protein [Altererythrobacter sp. ZODW24]|uniref:hypothetical protein n=1 Tax=Altererythrobacter sp. ZODW24 TaxID=2185142 RepID=UPI000DF83973|nr:hypothetical protein [Altererythrobacter sp. ZODW24]
MHVKLIAALMAVPLLAACAASPKPTVGKSTSTQRPIIGVPPGPPPRQQPQRPVANPVTSADGFRTARVMDLPGLEGVIGANEGALTQQFGTPRLNVKEGDARKLQFSGESCVMDVYLYPPRPGGEPMATYVDTRRASDGFDVDRAACVAALRGR